MPYWDSSVVGYQCKLDLLGKGGQVGVKRTNPEPVTEEDATEKDIDVRADASDDVERFKRPSSDPLQVCVSEP